MRFVAIYFAALLGCTTACAEEWRVDRIDVPARVEAVETVDGVVRVKAGGLWYALKRNDGTVTLNYIDPPAPPKPPAGALPDGEVATGQHDIARAWFAEPTDRYEHGTLDRKTAAGALVIETRDGRQQAVRLKGDAVVAVKSYLKRGSALAVVGERKGRYEVIAETPPLGAAGRWLDPVGIGDFTGVHKIDVALVRQPHDVGVLEIWSWRDNELKKIAELSDTANHIAGSHALDMAAVADFNGDNVDDIAIPSLDRSRLRIVSFAPNARELASVALPAKAATNLGLIKGVMEPAVAVGLDDGSLAVVQRRQ